VTDQALAEFRRLLAGVDGITSVSAEASGIRLTVETTLPRGSARRDAIYDAETALMERFPDARIDFRVRNG
jgi:hypothetical protein